MHILSIRFGQRSVDLCQFCFTVLLVAKTDLVRMSVIDYIESVQEQRVHCFPQVSRFFVALQCAEQ